MDILLSRPHRDHDQRRGPARRYGARGAGAASVARRGALAEASRRAAAMADREGEARDLRRHARAGRQAACRAHAMEQSVARGRLDGDGVACDHRRGDTLRRDSGPIRMNQIDNTVALEATIRGATAALLDRQRDDGHWVFELEADATIPAEYVLLVHYLAERPDLELERKIGVYLRRIQADHGGWPLYHGGHLDISATVKAYFALKMIGDDIDAPHMVRARAEIIKRGGALKANVFTRILLALYGETSWANVPTVPVELILLPRWFPIHLSKMSYWARTVIVPLLVLAAKQPVARNPRGVHIAELFPPGGTAASKRAPHQSAFWSAFFGALDWVLKRVPWPKGLRKRAIDRCVSWTTERLNGEDGLGAIYPAMANSVMMYDVMGYAPEHPDRAIARLSVEKLLVGKDHEAYCHA